MKREYPSDFLHERQVTTHETVSGFVSLPKLILVRVLVRIEIGMNQSIKRSQELIAARRRRIFQVGAKYSRVVPAKPRCFSSGQTGIHPRPQGIRQMFMAKGARNPKAGVAQRIFLQTHIDCPGFSVNCNEPGAAVGELFVLLAAPGKGVQVSTTGKPAWIVTAGEVQYDATHAPAVQRMRS